MSVCHFASSTQFICNGNYAVQIQKSMFCYYRRRSDSKIAGWNIIWLSRTRGASMIPWARERSLFYQRKMHRSLNCNSNRTTICKQFRFNSNNPICVLRFNSIFFFHLNRTLWPNTNTSDNNRSEWKKKETEKQNKATESLAYLRVTFTYIYFISQCWKIYTNLLCDLYSLNLYNRLRHVWQSAK